MRISKNIKQRKGIKRILGIIIGLLKNRAYMEDKSKRKRQDKDKGLLFKKIEVRL